MIHTLLPWPQLIRSGEIPPLSVIRRPLLINGEEIPVGAVVNPDTFSSRTRLRTLYEQRRLAPVTPPPNTREAISQRQAAVAKKKDQAVALEPQSYTPSRSRKGGK